MKYKVVIFYVCADDLAETIKGTGGKLERRKQSAVLSPAAIAAHWAVPSGQAGELHDWSLYRGQCTGA